MILSEVSSISAGVLPFYDLKNHLQMGTGFEESNLQDPLLEVYMRAAISMIENRYGLVVFQREFVLTLTQWRNAVSINIPTRPVVSLNAISVFDNTDNRSDIDLEHYNLVRDSWAPYIVLHHDKLPIIDNTGRAEVRFLAGYSPNWEGLSSDLRQAILITSAHFYENRLGGISETGVLPSMVSALLEPYRPLRISVCRK